MLKGGYDRHVWDLPPRLGVRSSLVGWLTELFFITGLCVTKVSILLFFRRLIDGSYQRALSFSIIGAILFTTAYWIAFLFFLIFACDPVDAAWKSSDIAWRGKYRCASRRIMDPVNGILSAFSDAYSIGSTNTISFPNFFPTDTY